MASDDDELMREFLMESRENLNQLDRDFVALEQDPRDPKLLGAIFRCVHTIKGTAGFLGLVKLEALTHIGESQLSRLRDGVLALDTQLTSALLAMVDAIRRILTGLATPMSIMVATGKGATMGVLFRNAEAIEVLRKVDTLVVDKTGTLTEGKPQLVSVVSVAGTDEATLLRLAATLEKGSEHPLVAAIVKGAENRELALGSVQGFESVTGKGVRGQVDGKAVALLAMRKAYVGDDEKMGSRNCLGRIVMVSRSLS